MGDFLRALCKWLVVVALVVFVWQYVTTGVLPWAGLTAWPTDNAGTTAGDKQATPASSAESASLEGTITSEKLMNETNMFAYSNLSGAEKTLYRELLVGIVNHEDSIDVTPIAESSVQSCASAVVNDHPEIFFWGGSARYQMSSRYDMKVYSVEPTYTRDKTEAASIDAQLDAVYQSFSAMLDINASDYDKVLAAYTYIVDTTDYRIDAAHSQTVDGALIDGAAVCAGYSRAFEYLMQRSGVECGYVTGMANSSIMQGPHAWNIVYLGGVYTYVDCTWGDPLFIGSDGSRSNGISYEYLCVGDETLFATHVPDDASLLPECVDYPG